MICRQRSTIPLCHNICFESLHHHQCNSVQLKQCTRLQFLAISYHTNRYDYFCSTIRTDCFQNYCLGMIFCWKPKNNVFYDMLKFATNCAYISALGVKGEKFTINEHKLWINNEFLQNLWLDCFSYALGSNKGRQITTIVKELWFSMS